MKKPSERASRGVLVTVKRDTSEEYDDGAEHSGSRDSKSEAPPVGVLYVNKECDSEECTHVNGKEEPVEE